MNRLRNLLASVLMLTVVPTVWTNCDVGPDKANVRHGLQVMHDFEMLKREIPRELWRRIEPVLQAATTQPILTQQLRGSTAGSVTVGSTPPGGIRFDLLSTDWLTQPAGSFTITVQVDRSFDGGVSWQGVAGFNPYANVGPGCVNIGKFTCLPFLAFSFDGVASTWRWTITPSTPFSWGANASFF